MKIAENVAIEQPMFKSINVGECFMCQELVFMRVITRMDNANSVINAVALKNGALTGFAEDDRVIPAPDLIVTREVGRES